MKTLKTLAALLLGSVVVANATSVVEYHGALATSGANVVDSKGNQVQLTGMSFFWDNWMDKYYNKAVVDWLVKDWQCSILRAAMGVEASGGYLTDASGSVSRVETVVDAAIANGVYVIIDWHEENAVNHVEQSKAFFSMMAQKYGDQPNVIFEIYNEPHKASPDYTWAQIKTYAEAVIPEIRKYSNNLIVVGTPQYSLNVSAASKDPITSASNIAYTLHFYAGTHSDRISPLNASNKIPLMVTEWGTTIADGGNKDKTAYTEESQAWYDDLIDPRKISSCNWSVSDKAEGASILVPNASVNGGWDPETALTPSGKWVRNMIRKHCADDPTVCPVIGSATVPPVFALPGTITAVDYSGYAGLLKETTQDAAGGQNLTSIAAGDWSEYTTNAASAFQGSFRARVASASGTGIISMQLEGNDMDSLPVPATGGPQSWVWAYGTRRTAYTAGDHKIGFQFKGTGSSMFNLHRAEIVASAPETASVPGLLNPLGYLLKAQGMGIAEIGEDGAIALFGWRNGANTSYRIKAATAGTLALVARVSGNSTGSKLEVKNGATSLALKATIDIPSTGGNKIWQDIRADIAVPAGVSTLKLGAVGDTGSLFNISNIRFLDPVSVQTRGTLPGVGLRRGATSLTLSIPAGHAFREVQLLTMDGRILSRQSVLGGSVVEFAIGNSHQPMWIRLVGARSTTIAVPPSL